MDAAQTTPIPDGTTDVVTDALPAGSIEVKLTWPTNADIQLSVRDPFGETVYDDAATIRSGGVLASDGNRQCEEHQQLAGILHLLAGKSPDGGRL